MTTSRNTNNPYATRQPWATKARTGRTTRLLQQAILEAMQNRRAVYVVAANSNHQHSIQSSLAAMNPPVGHGIKIENAQIFPELDWDTLTLRRGHPNCLVLVDHYAIECRYHAVLSMWGAFDYDGPDDETLD